MLYQLSYIPERRGTFVRAGANPTRPAPDALRRPEESGLAA